MRGPRKRLTEKTEEAVELLYRPKFLRGILSGHDDKIALVEQIAESLEPEAIPDLLPLVVVGWKDLARASARAVRKLVEVLKPRDFVQFDQYVRQGSIDWRKRRESWYELKPRDVTYLGSFGEEAASLVGIASCHISGYVRQAAVEELGKIKTGAELPFLLMRVNDWVPNVRDRARSLLQKRVRADYVPHFVPWLPLVARLRELNRWNQADLVKTIDDLLEAPEAATFLRAGTSSEDRDVRRFCYGRLLRRETDGDLEILRCALSDHDAFVRLHGIRALTARPADQRYLDLLQKASGDPFPRVRLETLTAFMEIHPAGASELLENCLLDANISVRETAQFYAEKSGRSLREFYLGKIASVDRVRLAAAIAGLGEKGKTIDTAVIEPCLSDPSPRVRAATVRGLAKLDGGRFVDEFLAALNDESRKVAREGILALSRRTNTVGGARLWKVFERCRNTRERRGVLFLISRLSRWEGLPYLMLALGDPEPEVAGAANRSISRLWMQWNRSFVTPTQEQAALLKKVIGTHSLLIGEERCRWLKKLLEG